MKQAGLTLIEVTISLGLLSSLFLVTAAWIAEAGRTREAAELTPARTAWLALVEDVRRALRTGDDPLAEDRVRFEPGSFSIRGRRDDWRTWRLQETGQAVWIDGSGVPALEFVEQFGAAVPAESEEPELILFCRVDGSDRTWTTRIPLRRSR